MVVAVVVRVSMGVFVPVVALAVDMVVRVSRAVRVGESDEHRPHAQVVVVVGVVVRVAESDDLADEEAGAERDQKESDDGLDGDEDDVGELDPEQEEGEPNRRDGDRVPDAPRGTDESGAVVRAVDERRDGRDVVRLDGVTDPEQPAGDQGGDE
jgi:hypothetical protein